MLKEFLFSHISHWAIHRNGDKGRIKITPVITNYDYWTRGGNIFAAIDLTLKEPVKDRLDC
jgi:secreted protein with Ig-like and vWFA domain